MIEPRSVADRLSVTITLMLSAVAFRFVVSSMLPKVSYLTWMDYYILLGFVALIIMVGENAIVGFEQISEENAAYVDLVLGGLFGIIWVAVHIAIAWVMLSENAARIPWEVMDQLDKG